MITKYKEYIKESVYDNEPLNNSFIEEIFNFIKDNYINEYLHLAIRNERCFAICMKTKFPMTIPFIYIKYNDEYLLSLDVTYYSRNLYFKTYNNDTKYLIFKDIKDVLDNFYEKFKLIEISNVRNYPIIKIDKYIEYLHKILINKDVYKDFMDNVYKESLYKKLKPIFDKEFDYLLQAKNFDLI